MSEISIGLAGVGYWGSKLARNVYEAEGCALRGVSDPDQVRREAAAGRYPGSVAVPDVEALVALEDLDAVILATPASMHAKHARAVLEAGKHVMVEKPLALSSVDCDELCALASERRLTLMVGHTFIYSEPVRVLRRLIESGELGQILYVYGQRVNLGVIREDLNALWNFGPHDVSILLHLLDSMPVKVSAQQFAVLNRSLEDIAFVVLEFGDGVVGHIHESWLDPRKIRQFTVVGDRKMAVYDDTDIESPLRIYDKGVAPASPYEQGQRRFQSSFRPEAPEGFGEFKVQIRAGDMVAPRVNGGEPLRVEVEHFVECVKTGAQPLTDGQHGREVVRILEVAERSAAEGGRALMVEEAVAVDRSPA